MENGSYVLVEKGSVKKSRLERPWLIWATVATIWGRGGNTKLISEKVTGTNYKLSFEFFECKK